MTFADLAEMARERIAERAALIKRFERGGDLDFIEDPQHQANIIGPPLMLEHWFTHMIARDTRIFMLPESWKTADPETLRSFAAFALKYADEKDARAV